MLPRLVRYSIALVLLPTALASLAMPVRAQEHAHHQAPAVQDIAQSGSYATDAPLRENMAGIRTAVVALEHGTHGHLDAAQVTALADKVSGHVREIVARCKLPPDADAALHRIIVPLVQEAGKLKAQPQDLSPVAAMRDALDRYDAQFAD